MTVRVPESPGRQQACGTGWLVERKEGRGKLDYDSFYDSNATIFVGHEAEARFGEMYPIVGS
jgi:hypothetical protein